MTFLLTLYVREGIVMAADSRMTLSATAQQGPQRVVQVAVGQSDSTYKLFLTPKGIGISTYGDADIQGVPITGYIESFINEELPTGPDGVEDIPKRLLSYFSKLPGPPDSYFHVAGYKQTDAGLDQQVWLVEVVGNSVKRLNRPGTQGANWGGEADIVSRLVQPVAILDNQGNIKLRLPYFEIPWGFFTLQDAIDFTVYAVKVTIDSLRFQPRAKTVGGHIDVLVVKPDKAFWVQQKELRVQS